MNLRNLFELDFNNPRPYTFHDHYIEHGHGKYKFKTSDDRDYEVSFNSSDPNEWEVAFKDEDGYMSLTGKGKSFEVIITVVNIVKDFVHKHNPDKFYFYADKTEQSRVKLYTRICKRLSPELVNYEYDIDYGANDGRLVEYTFWRIGHADQ